jgi:hypothetical protein
MLASVEALLGRVVDYAGTFPPATLPLGDAMANYAEALAGPHAALLGRFVVPAPRLQEMARILPSLPGIGPRPWPLSVLVNDAASDREAVSAFSARSDSGLRIEAMELAPLSGVRLESAAGGLLRDARAAGIEVFVECALGGALEADVAAIGRAGALAKIRTGGTAASAFPSARDISRFIHVCAEAGVGFKATAGLHHALSGRYPLTYDAGSAVGDMYGFLNVLAAAVLRYGGAAEIEVGQALVDSSMQTLSFSESGLQWRGRTFSVHALIETRRRFVRSFGSCSFGEPIAELERLGLI